MPRAFIIHGECLVKMAFGAHVSGGPFTRQVSPNTVAELTDEQILAAFLALAPAQQTDVINEIVLTLGTDRDRVVSALFGNALSFQAFYFAVPGARDVTIDAIGLEGAVIQGVVSHVCELGLARDQIFVSPKLYHQDLHPDDLGPSSAGETLFMGGECLVRMDLIHWDEDIFEMCMVESMAGGFTPANSIAGLSTPTSPVSGMAGVKGLLFPQSSGTSFGTTGGGLGGRPPGFPGQLRYLGAGTLGPVGQPMGRGRPVLSSGCHYMMLNVMSPKDGLPYRFRACYLSDYWTYPMGSKATVLALAWRAVPYAPIIIQDGNNYTTTEPTSCSGYASGSINIGNPFGLNSIYDHSYLV